MIDTATYGRFLPTHESTREVGAHLGRVLMNMALPQPFIVTLEGELGAGKTTFVGGLLAAMGHDGPVRSPTYTLIEPYEFVRPCHPASLAVFHLDLYRLVHPSQLHELGVYDLLQPDTVLLVEWPSKAVGSLPTADFHITLEYVVGESGVLVPGSYGRQLTAVAHSELAQPVCQSVAGGC